MPVNAAETERSASLVDLHLHKLASGAGLAIRAALGATIADVIATSLGLQHPIYALVAAIIGTEFVSRETTKLGFQQLVATAFGAISGTLIRTMFPSSAASAGLGILISVLACYVTIREGAKVAKIAGYVTAIIILDEGQRPFVHGLFRFIEIALGIAVSWLLSLVPRLIRMGETMTAEIPADRPQDVAAVSKHVRAAID
jgi:uncharacterized membrane protein YgaE (UPF0421/DUF939 family)